MTAVFQEFIALLTRPPGNLIYHVLLSFSVAAALPSAINHWRSGAYPQARRMVVGLVPILLAWLVLFLVGGLSWQGLLPEHNLLPPLDRAVTLFSLVLLVWLWVFPEAQRFADAATLLLVLFTLSLSAMNVVWWFTQGSDLPYNGLLIDRIIQAYAVFLAFVGLLLLVVRRPAGWSFGFSMLAFLFAGHLVQLFFPDLNSDFAGPVRLAQVAAYPILLAMPQRFPLLAPPPPVKDAFPTNIAQPASLDPGLLESLLKVIKSLDLGGVTSRDLSVSTYPDLLEASSRDLGGICPQVAQLVAKYMLADICFLVSSPDDDFQMSLLCGYDLISQQSLEGANLDGHAAPLIASAMHTATLLYLPEENHASDQVYLAELLELEAVGDLLCVPVNASDGYLLFGLLLLSPYSKHSWSDVDQSNLTSLATSLAYLLQQSNQLLRLYVKLENMQKSGNNTQVEINALRQEKQDLLDRLDKISSQAAGQPASAEELEALIAAQQKAQITIERLQAEIKKLRHEPVSPTASFTLSQSASDLDASEGELRLALEEIARLRASASVEVGDGPEALPPLPVMSNDERVEAFIALAHDLRQPLSSITGYTDFLLGETVGILGALQRKFLERIKLAAERMSTSLNDMFHVTGQDTTILQLNPELVDLSRMIDQAILKTSDQLRQKRIAMRVDMPEKLPELMADPAALEQVLINLLENAGKITPSDGEISLRLQTKGETNQPGFVLIQIADQGGGIDPQDMGNVFSRLHRQPVKGAGDSGAGLSIVKTLVESMGGRIWVDSVPDTGAVFSVLMPIHATELAADNNEGAWN
jgi:signal transduction histidine kinase